jgi:hypothetical protein
MLSITLTLVILLILVFRLSTGQEGFQRTVSDCYDSYDPITGEDLTNENNEIVFLGDGPKYNCFKKENIQRWFKTRNTNPMTNLPVSDDVRFQVLGPLETTKLYPTPLNFVKLFFAYRAARYEGPYQAFLEQIANQSSRIKVLVNNLSNMLIFTINSLSLDWNPRKAKNVSLLSDFLLFSVVYIDLISDRSLYGLKTVTNALKDACSNVDISVDDLFVMFDTMSENFQEFFMLLKLISGNINASRIFDNEEEIIISQGVINAINLKRQRLKQMTGFPRLLKQLVTIAKNKGVLTEEQLISIENL